MFTKFLAAFLILGTLIGISGIFYILNYSQPEGTLYYSKQLKKSKSTIQFDTTEFDTPISSSSSILMLTASSKQIEVKTATVVKVVDANTLTVLKDNKLENIDLLGLELPLNEQIVSYENCNNSMYISTLETLILGKKIYLISDKAINQIDENYQPKYIFLEDLTFLNKKILSEGLAKTSDENGSLYLYKEDFKKEEILAQNNLKGIWAKSCPEKIITPTVVPAKAPSIPKTKPTPTKIPTNLYSQLYTSPTPTTKPTATPIPQQEPLLSNTTTSSSPQNSLNSEIIFVLINNHRKDIGKPAFEKDEQLCNLARERGPELNNEIFGNGTVHAGLYSRNLPYWITENMASYPSEEQVFNWWMGSTIHRKAIESDNKYSCGECNGNSCAQLFTSYIPK